MENPYAAKSLTDPPAKSTDRRWTMIGVAFLLSLSFVVSTVMADNLPDKTNHALWFPLSVYSLPFTIPGMLLVHMGYSDVPVYSISFAISFLFSLGLTFVVQRLTAKAKRGRSSIRVD